MKIAIASDHAGYEEKERLKPFAGGRHAIRVEKIREIEQDERAQHAKA